MDKKVKIKMLKNSLGSPDGKNVITYEKDNVYELNEFLAKSFVKYMRVAEYISDKQLEKENNKVKEVKENNKVKEVKENNKVKEILEVKEEN